MTWEAGALVGDGYAPPETLGSRVCGIAKSHDVPLCDPAGYPVMARPVGDWDILRVLTKTCQQANAAHKANHQA